MPTALLKVMVISTWNILLHRQLIMVTARAVKMEPNGMDLLQMQESTCIKTRAGLHLLLPLHTILWWQASTSESMVTACTETHPTH